MEEKRFPETTLTLNDSRTVATLKIGQETVVGDADSLLNFISHLGVLRQQMEPQVPRRSPEARQFLQLSQPAVEIVDSDDGSVVRIALRTPTYGWIGFQFLPHQAAGLGRHLVAKLGGVAAAPSPKLDS
ncbi:MAG: hypothetical protein ACR2HE_04590 [Casimicrobiaceae bacterium]